MSWLSQPTLLAIVLGYLLLLFLVASVGEAFAARLGRGRPRTITYVLAASVYCTAWTFYGSVGLAANRGLEFLTIYLGPALVALLWPLVLRKLVRVSKEQRITSISDFISSRYGKSANLGTLVALLVVAGMIPYIALQLRAVSTTFSLIIQESSVLNVFDPTLLVPAAKWAFVAVRLLGLVVLVPVFEELFWRSFLIRWLIADDFTRVPIGRVTPMAAAVSSVVFGAVHPEWLPGVLTGLCWAWLVWRTKSLSACVVSHATANLALGLYVLATGQWKFW